MTLFFASWEAFDTGQAQRSIRNMAPQPVATFPAPFSTVTFAYPIGTSSTTTAPNFSGVLQTVWTLKVSTFL